jgi:hypothetical protein
LPAYAQALPWLVKAQAQAQAHNPEYHFYT